MAAAPPAHPHTSCGHIQLSGSITLRWLVCVTCGLSTIAQEPLYDRKPVQVWHPVTQTPLGRSSSLNCCESSHQPTEKAAMETMDKLRIIIKASKQNLKDAIEIIIFLLSHNMR